MSKFDLFHKVNNILQCDLISQNCTFSLIYLFIHYFLVTMWHLATQICHKFNFLRIVTLYVTVWLHISQYVYICLILYISWWGLISHNCNLQLCSFVIVTVSLNCNSIYLIIITIIIICCCCWFYSFLNSFSQLFLTMWLHLQMHLCHNLTFYSFSQNVTRVNLSMGSHNYKFNFS